MAKEQSPNTPSCRKLEAKSKSKKQVLTMNRFNGILLAVTGALLMAASIIYENFVAYMASYSRLQLANWPALVFFISGMACLGTGMTLLERSGGS